MRLRWLPFELHPEAPQEGIPFETYFGDRAERVRGRLGEIAAEAGLEMRQRDVLINSRRALSAAEFAREQGKFDQMHQALFKAHWEQTGRLEDIDDLVRIGTEVGLDPVALRLAIEDGRYESVLDGYRIEAEAVGVRGIPAHIFGGRFFVVGAQPYEVFIQVLQRLRTEADS